MTEQVSFDYDKYDFKDSTKNYVYKGKRGLSEDIVKMISETKDEPEWMLEGRLKAFQYFKGLVNKDQVPGWANLGYNPINFQEIIFFVYYI